MKKKNKPAKKKPSRAAPKPKVDWESLGFKLIPTDKMFLAQTNGQLAWQKGRLLPFGEIRITPAAAVLNYGQGLFEGMKAQRSVPGNLVLFRPQENAKRFGASARRLAIPPYPEGGFVEAVKATVRANESWVPPAGRGSLYIRPVLFGSGGVLGIQAAPAYTFCIFVCPVGPYFKGGFKPVRLLVTREYHRAAPKGVGGVKVIGNYAPCILPNANAKAAGYNEIIYLDGKETKYIEEVGAGNFFCVLNGTLVTPPLTGTILPGVTRNSVLTLARDQLKLAVEERPVSLEEALQAQEAFCTGTAAVVSSIGSVTTADGEEHVFNNGEPGPVTKELYRLLTGIQTQALPDPYGWVVEI